MRVIRLHYMISCFALSSSASVGSKCPTVIANKSTAQVVCPAGYTCTAKVSKGRQTPGACHFEYPPGVPPHRENCWGCEQPKGIACEPNLPNFAPVLGLPNVLIVGDSISHGYFPLLAAALNGTANLQHAPSNTGALQAGIACFNITTLDALAENVKWDVISYNFGLHDTSEPTPPPVGITNIAAYVAQLRHYTELALSTGAKPLFALTTPYMANNIYKTLEVMNSKASGMVHGLGVPTVDLYTVVAGYCGPLPYTYCDICMGATPTKKVDCHTTPHYNAKGYQMLTDALVPAIKALLPKAQELARRLP
jgi:acyl-CoA thioesterase-1